VGAATRPCAGRATLEWSRDYGGVDLEGRERRQNVIACVFWVGSVLATWDKWRSSGMKRANKRLSRLEIYSYTHLGTSRAADPPRLPRGRCRAADTTNAL
jgi:hypothetical protein